MSWTRSWASSLDLVRRERKRTNLGDSLRYSSARKCFLVPPGKAIVGRRIAFQDDTGLHGAADRRCADAERRTVVRRAMPAGLSQHLSMSASPKRGSRRKPGVENMLGHAPPPLTANGLDMRDGHPAELEATESSQARFSRLGALNRRVAHAKQVIVTRQDARCIRQPTGPTHFLAGSTTPSRRRRGADRLKAPGPQGS